MLTYEYEKGPGRSIVIVIGDETSPIFARQFRDLVTAQEFMRDALLAVGNRQRTRRGGDVPGLLLELAEVATKHGGTVPREMGAVAT